MSFSVLVLAGTRPGGDPLAGAEGKAHKALIEIEGRPLLERVVTALREAGSANVAVSCDHPEVISLAKNIGAQVLPTGRGPSESAAIGFERLGAPLLITTADHALLQPEWVRHLVNETPDEADIGVMLARREDIEAALPESRRTYLKFADGDWSGCNLFFLRTSRAGKAIDSWKMIEADRKRPWRIVGRLGLSVLVSYAFRRLSLAQGIESLGRRFGIEARLVEAQNGLAAVDVDKQQDLDDIRYLLKRNSAEI